jgi:phosphonate transport system ATP-binding protein
MLKIKNLSKKLPDGRLLLEDISLDAAQGDFVGILGASGVGKTVLLRCINGLTKPDGGVVVVRNGGGSYCINRATHNELRRIRQRIGVVFQSFNLVKRVSVIDNVMMGKLGQVNQWRSIFLGFSGKELRRGMEALERVGVRHLAERRVETLSGGEMQRVAIARAIFQEPFMLLLDEPVANLDPKTSEAVMDCIDRLKGDMLILGVFHQPNLVAQYCNRVIGIKAGRVTYDGDAVLSDMDLMDIYGSAPVESQAREYALEPAMDGMLGEA